MTVRNRGGAVPATSRRLMISTIAVAAAALTAIAGCSSSPRPAVSAPTEPVSTPSASKGVQGLHLPIETYMLTPAQSIDFEWVSEAAIGACMRRFGQDYPVPPKPGDASPSQAKYSVLDRRYGVSDLESVRIWGYHPPASDDGVTPPDGKSITIGQLPEDARTVLLGANPRTGQRVTSFAGKPLPEHGCLAEPDRLVPGASGGPIGPGGGGEGVVTLIKAKSFSDSQADPRVVSAIGAWSTCMKIRGYDTPDPLRASEHLASIGKNVPDAAEISQAVADVECKRNTNLIGVWFSAESDLQNAAINQNAAALTEVKTALQQEISTIERLSRQDWSAALQSG